MPRSGKLSSKPHHDPLHVQIDNDQVPMPGHRIRRQKTHRETLLNDENQVSSLTFIDIVL
jgi:hypothetical protein